MHHTVKRTQPHYISIDGVLVPYAEAMVHVLSPAILYGTTAFEGIRGYWNAERNNVYLFRLDDHLVRLCQSARVMQLEHPYCVDDLRRHVMELVRACGYREDLYLRILMFPTEFGPPETTGPVAAVATVYPRGRLKPEGEGLHACVSTWRRIADDVLPPRIKCAANYQNSRLALLEAQARKCDTAILLTSQGKVSETPLACLFIVRDGRPITPAVTEGILEGITRDSLISLLANELECSPVERPIDRTELYVADEAFICGTAAEVLPLLTIDGFELAAGREGNLTKQLRTLYVAAARRQRAGYETWGTPVYA